MFYDHGRNIQSYPTPILYIKRGVGTVFAEDKAQLSLALQDANYLLAVVLGGAYDDAGTLGLELFDADYFLAVVDGAESDEAALSIALFDADYFLAIVDGAESDAHTLSLALLDADYFLAVVEDVSPEQFGTLNLSLLSAAYEIP